MMRPDGDWKAHKTAEMRTWKRKRKRRPNNTTQKKRSPKATFKKNNDFENNK